MIETKPSDFAEALYKLVKASYEQGHGIDAVMEILSEQGIKDDRFKFIVEQMFLKIEKENNNAQQEQ